MDIEEISAGLIGRSEVAKVDFIEDDFGRPAEEDEMAESRKNEQHYDMPFHLDSIISYFSLSQIVVQL